MSASNTPDLEKQSHQIVDHPIQNTSQQQLPLHAHLEPEDVRVAPFQMDVNMNPPLNAVLQTSTPLPNPGPFGLCAFALTAFCMGLYNLRAGVDPHAPVNFITGTAMFYGGLGQVKYFHPCSPKPAPFHLFTVFHTSSPHSLSHSPSPPSPSKRHPFFEQHNDLRAG